MIEINLLPEELRKKKIKINIPTEGLWIIVPSVIGIFVFVHLLLATLVLVKNIQYKSLNKRWLSSSSSKQEVDSWKREFNLVSQDTRTISNLTQQRLVYSGKLKIMSDVLPSGIWFTRLSVQKKSLILEGSIVSLEADHMSTLRDYIEKLKNNPDFFSDFRSLKLGPVRMREFKGYQIMDFILEGILK